MISWIKSQASASAGASGSMERKKVEPGAMYSLLENHWAQALEVMQTTEDSDGALIVISHLSQMIAFLIMSRLEQVSPEKSCKVFWVQNRCSDQVIRWLHNLQVRGMQMPEEDELKLVAMLHSLCEAASRDAELLGITQITAVDSVTDSWDGTYALAGLLLEYSLRNTVELAQTARYSFIQLIQLAAKFPVLERSLSQESGLGLTNVVVSGLSACFAQLPTFMKATSTQLSPFVEQLKFVDEVTHAAPSTVATTIGECFTNAFLLAVIEPALTQSLNEEIGIVTFYLEVVCRNVTHPLLVKTLIQFVNKKLLNILIHRLDTHESVSVLVATLSLFSVLLESYCEDFWLEVILKYLTPQHHLMVSQRRLHLPQIDFYDSCTQFLSLVPTTASEVLGPYVIEASFLQYVNRASDQWGTFDTKMQSSLAVTRAAEYERAQLSGDATYSINPTFPLWKHKYHGAEGKCNGVQSQEELISDICHPDADPQPGYLQILSNTQSESEPASHPEHVSSESCDPLDSSSSERQNFMTINLQHGSVEDINTPRPHSTAVHLGTDNLLIQNGENSLPKLERLSIRANQSDGYASMESAETESPPVQENCASSTIASFGPFLDNLLVQLSNWPHLDLNVILMLTEVVSLLAACRIPLVNSLLLNPTLTLQPYFLTFNTLLKRIREDLEYQLQDVKLDVIRGVWDTMSRIEDDASGRGSETMSLSPSFSNQLSGTFRKTIAGGGAEAIASVWKRFNKKSSSPKVQVHPSSGTVIKSGDGNQVQRNETNLDSPPDTSRVMAMRMFFFAHWLLELGAIAQQQCWNSAY